jgi:Glycosyltransferase family 92
MLIRCLCLFLLCFCSLSARIENKRPKEKGKDITSSNRYHLSVCALFKNEAKYLKEWIEYHLLAGVDHFYLYNLDSTDNYMKALTPYIEKNQVTLIFWHDFVGEQDEENLFKWALGTQIPAYENAARFRAVKETKWLVFLDIDEFLVSPQSNSLPSILEKYNDYPGVSLACDCFDANSKKYVVPRRKLLIETLELTKAPEKNPQKSVCKTIFKPDQCQGFLWPPYKCLFKEAKTSVALAKRELRINHYANRNEGYFYASAKSKLHVDNRKLSEEQMDELLSLDYEIEDQDRVIYRFVPELLVRMGYDPTWGW